MSDEPLKWGQPSDIAKGVPTDAETAMAAINTGHGMSDRPYPMTADQQIRAKALEAASRILERRLPDVAAECGADAAQSMIWDTLDHFERYIREGK